MDERDLALRNEVYRRFAEGHVPTRAELADDDGLRRLHEAHALVLDEAGEIWMAHPFSGKPTPYRVEARGKWWYANCAWDAFGIPAALDADAYVETTCPECGDPIDFEVGAGHDVSAELAFHALVPAARWWDDIVFT